MNGFAALADPVRRTIVDLLAAGERDAGAIAGEFSISRPAISRHLRVLREAGLVNVRVEAQRRVYSVRPEGLMAVDDWLAKYRRFWDERLDALEHALLTDASGGETQ